MYNSNYEDYMRNVLGYNISPMDTYPMQDSFYEMQQTRNVDIVSLEKMYPDIYKMIYPMIQKVCMRAGNIINEEIIEKMTDEVYRVLEEDDKKEQETLKRGTEVKNLNIQNTRKIEETRQRNYLLRDFIKVLILRELLGQRPPIRPPMPHPRPPMRPPMPPPMPPRPPRY